MIFESDIEEKLVKGVEKRGGLCPKFGMDGWPDRLVILPGGQLIWVETKRPDGRVADLQKWRAAALRKLGQRVEIPLSKEDVQQILDSL
jgi:hypothetical protein